MLSSRDIDLASSLMLTGSNILLSEIIPKLIFISVFLAALDQTIAAVALPTIVRDIGGESGYSWVGTAYLLSKFSFQ